MQNATAPNPASADTPSAAPALRRPDLAAKKPSPVAERAIDFLKTLAWVAPLTVLIWIYAEREQSDTRPNISFPIEVRINDPNRIVTLRDPADGNVTATLTGPRTVLDQFIRELQTGAAGHATVQITLPSNLDRGVHQIDASRALADTLPFKRQGINAKDIHPQTLHVEIDDFETRMLDVRPSQPVPNLQDTAFLPAKVEVRAPSRLLREIDRDPTKFCVLADTTKLENLTKPGRQEVPGIPIQPSFKGDHITLGRATVTASVEVKRQEVELRLESVPVWLEHSPLFDKYKVQLQSSTIPDVHLVGPPREIDAIKNGEFTVKAILELTAADAASPRDPHSRKLWFKLPPGVSVTNPEDQYTVTFTLVPHSLD